MKLAAIMQTLKEQEDYLLFALAVCAVIFFTSLLVRRSHPAARLTWPVWLAIVGTLVGGWIAAEYRGQVAREEGSALIAAMAPTYAFELERGGHATITEATPTNDPTYLQLIESQLRWQKLNRFAHDIYTFRKRPDGTNILVVDSETDYDRDGKFAGSREARTPIGKIYPEFVPGLEKAFKGEANFDSDIIRDEWGVTVSAFVPMRDAQGRVEAVLGVDFDAADWIRAIAKERRGVMGITSALVLLIVVAGIVIELLRANIARRAQTERRLRESEERLRLTIEQLPLGFIEWDAQSNVLVWNPAAERIFGFSAEKVIGRRAFHLIVPPAAMPHVEVVWQGLLQKSGGNHSVNDNITKDGRTIVCEWFNTSLVGPDGKVASVFSLFQDVTERLNLQKQLQHSERLNAVGQLSAGVAHDFNNILTIITGHVGLLLAQETVAEAIKPDLRRIEDAALRAASLTRQLLAFSRQQAIFPRTLALERVVPSVAMMLKRVISENVHFQVVVAPDLPPVEADPAMIDQVVTNLVLNARDAMPKGGELTVSVDRVEIPASAVPPGPNARAGTFVRLTVRDTGSGIPAENLERIFEPFFTTKPTGKGTGLGLAVVHGIVQQHGGWIAVTSKPGVGTTFQLHFQPSPHAVAADTDFKYQPAAARVTPKTAQTILLAEDEELVRELCCHILEQAGFLVLAAADGPQALELWKKYRSQIDLLLTDMVMPNGMTGRELSERVLADCPNLPVIYTSGYSIELTAPGFCESERMVFLPKPYQAQQLVATVRKCFRQAGE